MEIKPKGRHKKADSEKLKQVKIGLKQCWIDLIEEHDDNINEVIKRAIKMKFDRMSANIRKGKNPKA